MCDMSILLRVGLVDVPSSSRRQATQQKSRHSSRDEREGQAPRLGRASEGIIVDIVDHWHSFSSLRWASLMRRGSKEEHDVERRDESKTKSVKISLLSHFWPDFLPEKRRHCSISINKALESVILGIRRPLFIHFIIITHSVPRHHFRQNSIFK